ncbi:unnamed protein product [Rodentolepis nana]|uniref:Protein muscleblind n=1 Tax=Rodentolepis nana TaxID=102285 RepID=A0A0R3TGI2_RODNA|nr:unnamed protein product [Rodentolepis nana]
MEEGVSNVPYPFSSIGKSTSGGSWQIAALETQLSNCDIVLPSKMQIDGTLYVPRMMGTLPNGSSPMFMTQQRSNQAPSGYYNPHHHQQMMLMMQHQQQPSSAIADDVVLPTSTLTHPPRNVQNHADN